MDTFRHADVERLSEGKDQWSASIFLPTHRTGTEMQQDPIRLKNLLREAENQLLAAGLRRPDVSSMLEPAEALLADGDFWQHQSDGLAVFASEGQFERFRVPLRLVELVIVARRFQLKPLFPLLTGDGHFYILALSQNEVRMLEATRHSVDEIEVEQLPGSFREAVGLDDQEKGLQFHTRSADRGGQRAAMFHGHGPGGEITKELLTKYFRQIDEAVCGLLNDDPAPLVLAGVDYYFPIYREVSRCRQLAGEGVAGNPETLKPAELHAKAWPLVEPMFRQARQAALARFQQLAGTGRTSTNVEEILPAAHQGRVEAALVATDRQQWGTFDSKTQAVVLQETADAHNEDLTDRVAIEAYLKRGVVYALPSGDLPDGAALAAIYRF
jgi:hypothetical protein